MKSASGNSFSSQRDFEFQNHEATILKIFEIGEKLFLKDIIWSFRSKIQIRIEWISRIFFPNFIFLKKLEFKLV